MIVRVYVCEGIWVCVCVKGCVVIVCVCVKGYVEIVHVCV